MAERTKPIISSTFPPQKMDTDSDPHFSGFLISEEVRTAAVMDTCLSWERESG